MQVCYLKGVNELAALNPNVQMASLGEVGQQLFGFFHGEGSLKGRPCGCCLAVGLNDLKQLPLGRLVVALPTIADATVLARWG